MPELEPDAAPAPSPAPAPRKSAASTVAAGILTSRLVGLVRERAVAHFFGVSAFADVLQAAFRAPNLLQNLLGEGTLSAAFIPIYSRMLEDGRPRDAGRFAGAVFGLLLALVAVVVLAGVLLAPYIVALLSPGFIEDAQGDLPGIVAWGAEWLNDLLGGRPDVAEINRYTLSVQAVRIMFPVTGTLVLAAWALGVLNSHRRFFLPYFAPVLMNVAVIGVLVGAGYYYLDAPFTIDIGDLPSDTRTKLLFATFFGALVGGILQFAIQLPLVFKVIKGFRVSFSIRVPGVREALNAFGPVVAGRGVVQLSSYLDIFLASFLAAGAVGLLRYVSMLYLLPISLFGLSVAASELPELSRFGEQERGAFLRRFQGSLRQILFLTIPTFAGYLLFGFLIVGALLRTGSFGINDNWLVYLLLGAYTLGLPASTMARLMQNAFYALNDTKTPAKIAALRVAVSTVIAVVLMMQLDQIALVDLLDLEPQAEPLYLGALGLGIGATFGAWLELWRLTASLRKAVPDFALPWKRVLQMLGLALASALPAAGLWWLLPPWHVALVALLVVGCYAVVYLVLARLMGFTEIEAWLGRFLKRWLKP